MIISSNTIEILNPADASLLDACGERARHIMSELFEQCDILFRIADVSPEVRNQLITVAERLNSRAVDAAFIFGSVRGLLNVVQNDR